MENTPAEGTSSAGAITRVGAVVVRLKAFYSVFLPSVLLAADLEGEKVLDFHSYKDSLDLLPLDMVKGTLRTVGSSVV